MVQNYFDDEEIKVVNMLAGSGSTSDGSFIAGKTKATYFNKQDASLKSDKFKVLVELTGAEAGEHRLGVDLVMMLDVSSSMKGKKLENMKTATKFLVRKLSHVDRLSIVKFSANAERLCRLRLMTPDAHSYVEGLVDGLEIDSGTNITAGLEESVKVLSNRMFTKGREVAIMLMSDGDPFPRTADGSQVSINNVAVHTFGLGQDYHPKVLHNIAQRSNGGTFSTADVENTKTSNLSIAFSQCLAGLLNVVVQDLTLTITKVGSTIEKVSAGNYFQSSNESEGSKTISFGNLYSTEIRSVLVDLVLDEVTESQGTDVLEFTYTYKIASGEVYDAPPVIITVSRTETPLTKESPKVLMEEARQHTANKMKEARKMADANRFDEARGELNKAKDYLKRDGLDKSHPNIKGLNSEVDQFLKLLESPDIYKKLGRAFAFASELSHALQRFAARGDVNELRLFATDAMDQYLDQVKNYEKFPDAPVQSSNEDIKERKVKNPYADIADILSMHLGEAIQSLKRIQDIINESH